jgi:hypothetical protein
MADWYYTTNKQQMGPVSRDELSQLANQGLLKPTDLVWKDGMRDWVRASAQGLFAEGAGGAAVPDAPMRSARLLEDEDDRPRRQAPRRAEEDLDDEADDLEEPRRRRARRQEGGMPVGVKVGLIVGGVVLLLIVAGVGLYFLLRPSPVGGMVAGGMGDFNGFLGPNDPRDAKLNNPSRIYNVQMVQGRTYVIDLRSKQFDAYLRLEDSGLRRLAEDDDSGGGLDARIVFRCPRTDNYRVIATSLDQRTGAYTLSIREN